MSNNLLSSYFARYIDGAQRNSHYVSYTNTKLLCLQELLEEMSKIQTTKIKKQFVNNSLNNWEALYIAGRPTPKETQVARGIIPLLKKHPEYLLISLDIFEQIKSISTEEKRHILRIRHSTGRIYMCIFWLIILRAELESE